MKPVPILLFATAALIVGPAAAQDYAQCIGFEEALEIATEVNPRIESAKAERDLASANLMGSMAQARPQPAVRQ